MASIKIWARVPDGAKLKLKVGPLAVMLFALCVPNAHAESLSKAIRRISNQVSRSSVVVQRSDEIRAVASHPVPAPQKLEAGAAYKVDLAEADERDAHRIVTEHLENAGVGQPLAILPNVERQAGAEGVPEVQLKAYVLSGDPLTFDPTSDSYVGTIKIGVTTITGDSVDPLSKPIQFEVMESAVAQPSQIVLNKTSPPFETIRIAVRDLASKVIRVQSRFNPEGEPVALRVTPRLRITSERARIQGYGLESVGINVQAIGLEAPQGVVVALRSDSGAHFELASLELDARGSARTTLRSDGIGRRNLVAESADVSAGNSSIDFDPPWTTVIASILGGLAGGLVRILSGASAKSLARFSIMLTVAVIVGILVFGLLILGVNTLEIPYVVRVGQVFVFIASAMGAWVGTLALPRVPA